MAYWGAAMTYNHPFWDPPSNEDLSAAWALVQKGLKVSKMSPRETMYLDAVAALYKDAGAGSSKSERDQAYLAAMKAAADKYPDDETRLFYGQMLLSTMPEGQVDDEIQPVVANILEEIYSRKPTHPGVLHYLTHVYDDPVNAAKRPRRSAGLRQIRCGRPPRAPHAFAHLRAARAMGGGGGGERERVAHLRRGCEAAPENTAHTGDFHALNYLQYAYIQLGRYRDAKRVTNIFQAEYDGMADKTNCAGYALVAGKARQRANDFRTPRSRGLWILRYIGALPDRDRGLAEFLEDSAGRPLT